MPATFYIPGPLLSLTGGLSRVAIDASPATVGEALRELGSLYPGLQDRLLDEQGQVRRHVNVFLGRESIRYTGGLDTPMRDGAEISIIPAISGG